MLVRGMDYTTGGAHFSLLKVTPLSDSSLKASGTLLCGGDGVGVGSGVSRKKTQLKRFRMLVKAHQRKRDATLGDTVCPIIITLSPSSPSFSWVVSPSRVTSLIHMPASRIQGQWEVCGP